MGIAAAGIFLLAPLWCQPSPSTTSSASDDPAQKQQQNTANEPAPKRILGIIPNYRTTPIPVPYAALPARAKFKMATEDTFDRGTVALGALFGAQSYLSRANPSFGDGWAAYGRYFAASYADFAVGNYMTEAIFPTVLHQDPRYFRRGTGSTWSRLGYAVKQTLWVHGDSGRMQFNYSEVVGNSAAVAISESYYSDHSVSNAVTKLGVQIGVDAAANVLKEFSTDINRKLRRRRHAGHDAQGASPTTP